MRTRRFWFSNLSSCGNHSGYAEVCLELSCISFNKSFLRQGNIQGVCMHHGFINWHHSVYWFLFLPKTLFFFFTTVEHWKCSFKDSCKLTHGSFADGDSWVRVHCVYVHVDNSFIYACIYTNRLSLLPLCSQLFSLQFWSWYLLSILYQNIVLKELIDGFNSDRSRQFCIIKKPCLPHYSPFPRLFTNVLNIWIPVGFH